MKHLFSLFSGVFFVPTILLSQSDGCASVPSLPVNSSCVTTNYSLPGSFNNGGLVTSTCSSTDRDDGWYSFVATSVNTRVTARAVSENLSLAIWSSCGGGTEVGCGNAVAGTSVNVNIITTIGTTYYVQLHRQSGNNTASMTGTVCVRSLPPTPANDNCTGAVNVPISSGISCTSSVSGTIAGATASSQANGCSGTADDDVWYSFVATNTTHQINLNNISGSTSDLYHSVYSGTCGSLGTALVCSDPESSTVSGLTVGNTYYVRVYSWTPASGQTSTFDICIMPPPSPPANDNCTNAINVPVSTVSGTCTYVNGTIAGATASSQANGCSGTADDDVWYSFVATSPGVRINLTNITGSTSDLYHSVYSGTCGSIGTALVCSDPNNSTLTGLIPGNTYYVRVFSLTATAGQTSIFDICIQQTGPCGTPNNQDYCMAPATLTQGVGNFSANTSGTYTEDAPANLLSLFCGSIENNSWYEFTATSTTHTFNFTSVTGTGCAGIQAQVYAVTEDINGCCTNFTSMSNCFHPGTAATGTVTATGLTIGQTYRLMVDGNGGSICAFVVSNWTATGIIALGVTYTDFSAVGMDDGNLIKWETSTEINSDYFEIERSIDGVNFEYVEQLDGMGTKYSPTLYSYFDNYRNPGTIYYRLKHVDEDGERSYSDILVLQKSPGELVSVYPNPVNDQLFVNLTHENPVEVSVYSSEGSLVAVYKMNNTGNETISIPTKQLKSGVYLLNFSGDIKVIETQKFIKK